MNLSTSVSKTTRHALLAAALVIFVGEIGIRFAMPFLSGDFMHLKKIPQMAEALERSKGPKILFLGNSTINNGIEIAVLRDEFERQGFACPLIAKINPDATDLWDWYFLYKNYFLNHTISKSILAVGFGRDWLDDQRPANPSRLAKGFARLTDLQELIAFDLTELSSIKEFLFASVFSLYCNRVNIRNRMMATFVPRFKEVTVARHGFGTQNETKVSHRNSRVASYMRLTKFIRMVKANGSLPVFIAMPTREKYLLSDELVMVAENYGAIILDMRNINQLSDAHFIDSVHLKPEGAAILSRELVKQLVVTTLSQHGGFSRTDSGHTSEWLTTGSRVDAN